MGQWLISETEFLTIAAETIKGLGPLKDYRQQHNFMLGENQQRDQTKSRQKFPECKGQHPVWGYSQFKSLDV